MISFENSWLGSSIPSVNPLNVDKSRSDYYIHYYKAKKLTSSLNHDWIDVKKRLDEIKNNILQINRAIDSEDYKAQTAEVIKAIDTATLALDENFRKLFSSVVRRMSESAESDEWFSETAKLYSAYILSAILGGNLYGSNKGIFSSNGKSGSLGAADAAFVNEHTAELSASSLQYGPRPLSQNGGSSTDSQSLNDLVNNQSSNAQIAAQQVAVQATAGEGRTIDIPDSVRQTGLCPNYTGYDKFYGKWTKGTKQRELSEQWGAAGKPSSNGIATLNNRYLVAVSPKFGKVGDNIDIVLRDGQVINATIADSKGNDATSEWGHVLTSSGAVDVIEWEASGPKSEIDLGTWRNVGVDKIVNLTS